MKNYLEIPFGLLERLLCLINNLGPGVINVLKKYCYYKNFNQFMIFIIFSHCVYPWTSQLNHIVCFYISVCLCAFVCLCMCVCVCVCVWFGLKSRLVLFRRLFYTTNNYEKFVAKLLDIDNCIQLPFSNDFHSCSENSDM